MWRIVRVINAQRMSSPGVLSLRLVHALLFGGGRFRLLSCAADYFSFFFLSAHVVAKTNAVYVVHNFRVLFAVQRMGVSLL